MTAWIEIIFPVDGVQKIKVAVFMTAWIEISINRVL